MRTDVPRVRTWLRDQAWAMLPAAYEAMVALLHDRAIRGGSPTPEQRAAIAQAKRPARSGDQVATIPVHGPIVPRGSLLTDISGLTSAAGVAEAVRAAIADQDVVAIVLDVDSPGGAVSGTLEAADAIYAMRGQKPIVASVNYTAASAAYWIATAADQVVMSPSAMVGSIGVFVEHWDESQANEQGGYRPTLIAAGDYKVEGNAYEPLSDEARTRLQTVVDAFHDKFVRAVARGRGVAVDTVRNDYGKGRMAMANEALAAGMVDRVETYEALVRRLQSPAGRASVSRAAYEDWRLRARAATLHVEH